MKKIFTILSLLTVLVGKSQSPYTWTNGGGDNDFENPLNWNPLPIFGFPSTGETAIFDGTVSAANCIMPGDEDINLLQMNANYTGTVDATGIDLTLTSISQSNGALLCPAGTLHIAGGNMVKSGGATFITSPSSVLEYKLVSSPAKTMSGSYSLAALQIITSGSGNRTLNFSTGTSTCSTLALNGGTNTMAYRGTINVTDQLSILGTATTAAPSNTGTILFIGTGSKTITGAASALQNQIGTIAFNTSGALNMTGNISIAGTWSVVNIGSFTQGTSTVTMMGGTITAGNGATSQARFDNLTILSGSTTVLSNNSFISLTGDLTHNGTLTSNNALFRLTGTGIQNIAGSASLTALNAIEVAAAGTKILGHAVQITDSVKVGTGNLISGGNLTLISTSSLKGRIAQITGGGAVTGNVNVQTFYPGPNTGWANICSPGIAGKTMGDWSNAGIAMTCSTGCTYSDLGGVAFESVYSYNGAVGLVGNSGDASHYFPLSAGFADPIDEKTGYWVYLGDGYPTSGDMTITMTGAINQGNSMGNYNLASNGNVSSEDSWNLISNPYPAPVSLTKMFAGNLGNIDNTIQVWNTDLNGGAGNFDFYVVGAGTDVVPMGQGMMVRNIAGGNVTLVPSESWKSTSNNSVKKSANNGFDYKNLFKLNLTGSVKNFDTYAYFDFDPNYSLGFDNGKDVVALDDASNHMNAEIYSKLNNDVYAISALPMPAFGTTLTIPLHIPTGYTDVYTINPMNINSLTNYCIALEDLSNNSIHDLYNGAYSTTITANNGSAPRFNLKVSSCGAIATTIPSNGNLSGVNPVYINKDASGVFVKLDLDKATKSTITVTNILGQKVIADKIVNTAKETVYLDLLEKNQLLLITVTNENGKVTKKLVH